MTSSIASNFIPILCPEFPVKAKQPVSLKSIKLDFSLEDGFRTRILHSTKEGAKFVRPTIEENSFPSISIMERLSQMSLKEREAYFLSTFNVEVQRVPKPNGHDGFKVILSQKSSSSTQSYPIDQNSVKSTRDLAELLKKLSINDRAYSDLQAMALAVIEQFSRAGEKTKPLIEEVSSLAYANNTLITRSLLKVLVKEIKHGELFEIDLLNALRVTLVNSLIDSLDADDLVQILRITMLRISQIHQQNTSHPKLHVSLAALSDILDVMGDANVIGIGRIDLKDPLYQTVDKLCVNEDFLVAAQAEYTKQALVRVPDDESTFRYVLRHGSALIKGFSSLYHVVSQQDISKLEVAYESLRDGFSFRKGKKSWYADVRILKLLIDKNLFKTFSNALEHQIKDKSNPHLIGNIFVIMNDLIRNHPELEIRKWALNFIADLYLNNSRWGDDKNVKQGILSKLIVCASVPNEEIAKHARYVLNDLKAKTKINEHRLLIDSLMKEPNELKSNSQHYVESTSTSLIIAAKYSNHLPLNSKLFRIRDGVLYNPYFSEELAEYTPLMGSHCIFDPKERTFKLDGVIDGFLNSHQPVFLLTGDSGAGKSTYLRYLERKLWQEWDSTKPIPLFIYLPSLKSPFQDGVNEALQSLGFSTQQCIELKSHHRFVFLLDGYDELKLKQNFYISNKLHEWKSQLIIACRTHFLIGDHGSYHNFFLPEESKFITSTSLCEAAVSPFSHEQIEIYGRKFIESNHISRTWEQYKQDLASLPGLKEIIETPFLLRIFLTALPSIIEKHKDKDHEKENLIQMDVFEEFINHWFNREHRRLIRLGACGDNNLDYQKLFKEYSINLSREMVTEGTTVVHYEESSYHPNINKWSQFFGSDTHTTLIRSGLPLKKTGPNSYSFIHKSLLEYFVARDILSNILLSRIKDPVIDNRDDDEKVNIDYPPFQSHNFNPNLANSNSIPQTLENNFVEENKFIVSHSNNRSSPPPLPPKPIHQHFSPPLQVNQFLFGIGNEISLLSINGELTQSSSIAFNGILNRRLLVEDEPEIIRLVAEAVVKDPSLEVPLFKLIEDSKTNSSLSIAAANAFTILNIAGVTFSHKKFKGICIPGADASEAVFYKTDLSYANLKNVIMADAYLVDTSLAHAQVEGLNLGQQPPINSGDLINDVAVHPNGSLLLLVSGDGTVRFIDIVQRKEIHCLQDESRIKRAVFSSNGKEAITVNENGHVCKWSLESGKITQKLQHAPWNSPLTLSKDGEIVVDRVDQSIRLWNVNSGQDPVCLNNLLSPSDKITLSLDNQKALLEYPYVNGISDGKTIGYWDLASRTELFRLKGHTDFISCISFSSNGKLCLSGSTKGTIRVWDLNSGVEILCLRGHTKCVRHVINSPNGKLALSGDDAGCIILWDLQTGKEIRSFNGHKGRITSLAFLPNGDWAVSCGHDDTNKATIRFWEIKVKKLQKIKKLNDLHFKSFGVASDGSKAIFVDDSGSLQFWNLGLGKELFRLEETSHNYEHIAFISDNKQAILAGSSGACVIDTKTGTKVFRITTQRPDKFAVSNDGKKALLSMCDPFQDTAEILQCDLQSGKSFVNTIEGETGQVHGLEISPDSKLAISFSLRGSKRVGNGTKQDTYGTIHLWDLEKFKAIHCFKYFGDFRTLASFSHDGQSFIVSSHHHIDVYETSTAKKLMTFNGHTDYITSFTLFPNSTWVVSGSSNGTAIIWDLKTGKEIFLFKHTRLIRSIHILNNGKRLIIADEQPSLKLWQIFDQNGQFKPSLLLDSSPTLTTHGIDLEGIQRLSEMNNKLLSKKLI